MTSKPKNLSEALEELENFKTAAEEEIKKTKHKVEGHLKEQPWATVGIIGLICFVFGFLLASLGGRRRD